MYLNIALWLVMVAVCVLFGWLALRAWRAKNAMIKWAGVVLSGLLTLVLAVVSVVTLLGLVKIYAAKNFPIPDVKVAGTPEQIQRGEHLANAFCVECHSTNRELPLSGGRDMGKDFPIPLGSFVPPNLTPGGELKDWSDGEIMRVLRSGVDEKGHHLFFMSLVNVRYMSDDDLAAVIAFLRSQPAVENETQDPPDKLTILAAIMGGAGMLPAGLPPVAGSITAPAKSPTAEYGKYLIGFQDCRGCHGEDLTGGTPGQLPPVGPNLRLVKGWTAEQFITTLRTGVDPSGHQLKDTMPWQTISRLDDVELSAMHAYLASLP